MPSTKISSLSPNGSKDFVEHLRAVHFTLLVLSFGLIVVALSAKTYDVVQALREIDEINALKVDWSSIRPKLKTDYVGVQIAGIHTNIYDLSLPIEGGRTFAATRLYDRRLEWEKQKPTMTLFVPQSAWYRSINGTKLNEVFDMGYPSNLMQFETWWNGFAVDQYVYRPFLVSAVGFSSPTLHEHVMLLPSQVAAPSSVENFKLGVSVGASQDSQQNDRGYLFIRNEDKYEEAFFPFTGYEKLKLNQNQIATLMHDWKPGPFEKSFRDLYKATKGLEVLRLEDVRQRLYDDVSKGTDRFEVFGLKLPVTEVVVWGTFVILSIQLYFLIFLKQLPEKLMSDETGWDVPWIGAQPSTSATIIFFVSVVLFPVAAVSLLASQRVFDLISKHFEKPREVSALMFAPHLWRPLTALEILALAACVLASLLLGLRCWNHRPKLAPKSTICSNRFFE